MQSDLFQNGVLCPDSQKLITELTQNWLKQNGWLLFQVVHCTRSNDQYYRCWFFFPSEVEAGCAAAVSEGIWKLSSIGTLDS